MLRDLRIFRRNSAKIPATEGHNENLPLDPSDSSTIQLDSDSSRPPLNTIQGSVQNPRSGLEPEAILRRKAERTPSKNQVKGSDGHLPFHTPEKPAALRNKFGWVPKSDAGADSAEHCEESSHQGPFHLPPWSRGASLLNGGVHAITTPRTYRTAGKASSVLSDCSSTQSTPTKSVTKPTYSGVSSSRPPLGTAARLSNFSTASKGILVTSTPSSAVNAPEVPHFDLREDPSFWMDHNIQVVIRVRPLNSTERNLQGYNRCLKQESAQTVTWIGQPESRFTFDYVACETINQEMLFRVAGLPMVENCMSGYNSCMFAYGQTGSGKTYTMLGEIDELEIRPSPDRGMTPRIFEFLFARIRAEEESRRDEKLRYNCKCSFLEIYNEQITDLLEPSSTNLLLREDLCKGVYVDNLAEFEVDTVQDILKLLIQGAANRKVAATNMNRESSRSHSVFTCVIESRWEKDSTTNLRFARLNLVDLAGSERQKTSGAEGERLKEAASINKSLSTLGHVIMVLADVANGKQRHIPYRDSRLTFLLQDSLGGNSKTIIMANVSPSICSASETLSTLKFAQRAKLIQNNAVVNEDASGDIIALQHQIHRLKEELSVLKRQNVSRSLSFRTVILEDSENQGCEAFDSEKLNGMVHMDSDEFCQNEASCSVRVSTKQLKSLEATLAGALRREKMADIALKQLEAEIEHLNRLVRQREDDTQGSKMMLKFREDKIHRMEALLDGLVPTESYLLEENAALSEEIQLLRTRADRNPEVTRFALENIRLLDQLRKFQDFYEEGERELLLAEVSELRNQLILFLDGKSEKDQYPKADMVPQLKRTCQELEDCKNNLKSCLETNARLTREISNFQIELNNIRTSSIDQHVSVEPQNMEFGLMSPHRDLRGQAMNVEWTSEYTVEHPEEILNLQLELDILKTILGEEKSSRVEVEKKAIHANYELKAANETVLMISKHSEDVKNELKDARAVIEALELQHLTLLNELEDLRENNSKNGGLLKKQEQEISILRKQLGIQFEGEGKLSFAHKELKDQPLKLAENEDSPLQLKMKRVQASLEKACSLSMRYQSDQASQTSIECEMDEVRRQVEIETAEVIVCLQDELMTLQQRVDDSNKNELLARSGLVALEAEIKELNERLSLVTQENENLRELTEEKERDLRSLTEDWERLAYEIADVLTDGNVALENASDQVASISDSFPHRSWISEQVDGMVRSISERDALIEELQKHLEDAQNVRCDMEWKLSSLRGAALAITEAQQQETSDKESEILQYISQLSEKNGVITELESRIKLGEEQTRKAEIRATVAFMTVNRLSEINRTSLLSVESAQAMLSESVEKNFQNDALLQDHISLHADAVQQIEALKLQLEQSQEHTTQLKSAQQEQAQALERQLQSEILQYTSQLSEKNGVITELESRIKLGEEQTRKAEIRATVAFMTVNRLSEINRTCLLSVESAQAMLSESVEKNFQKDALLQDHISLHADAVQQIEALKLQLEQSQEHTAQLKNAQQEQAQGLEHQLQSEILQYTSQLSEKNCVITELESIIKLGEEQTRKAEIRATVAFMTVNRLSEINKTCLLSVESAQAMLSKSVEKNFQKDVLLKDHISLHTDAVQQIEALKLQLKQSQEHTAQLKSAQQEQAQALERQLQSEILQYTSQLSEKNGVITELESRIKLGEEQTRKAEIRATVAFMTVNRLSEINRTSLLSVESAQAMLRESVEKNFQKDALLQDHLSLHADAVQQIEALKLQLEQSQEHTAQLKNTQQEQAQALERQLRKEKEDVAFSRFRDDLLKAKRVVNEIKIGVCTLHSCMGENARHVSCPAEAHHSGNGSVESAVYSEDLMEVKSIQTVIDNKHRTGQSVPGCSVESLAGKNFDGPECSRLLEDTYNRETTIVLLRRELESALDILKEVQAQMVNLLDEKEEIKKSEIQSRKSMEHLSDEVLRLTSDIADKEQHLEFRLIELERKLQSVEGFHPVELKIAEKHTKLDLVSTENLELKAHFEQIVGMKGNIEQELMQKIRVAERLEEEILVMSTLLGQRNHCLEDLQNDMTKLTSERDHLDAVVHALKEQLEMAQALAEENEAIATEARQIAEGSKVYAEDKEEEVRLLERSVEELECTVNALENKVEIIKGEAEKQRLQSEELEMELEAVRNQMLTVPVSCNICNVSEGGKIDFSRHLNENLTELREAQKCIQFLQKEIADKDAEIFQCKAHISELNMHADAQAREYKQKFRELEAMAQQVRADTPHSSTTSLTSTKAEKGAAKSRGSGSPFKCIGLGLSQQINSEKDEELSAARRQIEELEDLAARRQKEVFILNTRLAAAESMTHDVIRDLLGVKLDMTHYSLLLDHQQVQKVKEITRFDSKESQEKENEVSKLKDQLNEFIEERESWLDEINRRQTEMVAARIMLEKLRQREQSLTTENEILKADTAKYKKIAMELEDEVKKLSNQQNLQQRIHHHAKTKEENSLLKLQNEELNAKLERSEAVLSRVKEELARYRASSGKKPYVDIDEEEHLRKRLDDKEEERMQLAQKLLSLCTGILKAAGLPHSAPCVSPSAAEDALNQLNDRTNALETELQDLKLQCRVSCEKIRLSELKQLQSSPSDEGSLEEADGVEGRLLCDSLALS